MKRWERRWLILGIGVFCLVRASSVLVPAAVLNTPRLGDDALIYLWKGALNRHGYDASLPAVRDILEQRYLADNPPEPVSRMRVRVTGKVAGSPIPIYDLLTRWALSFDLPHKWAFALTELPGVALMAVAFTGFLLHLVGEGAAGIGLALLAFAILPNQGIASFIPSTLALSLSVLLWTYLLQQKGQVRLLPVYAGAVIILGVHPIGWVYVLMAIPLHAVNLQCIGAVGQRRNLWLYGGLVSAVLLSFAVPRLAPALAPVQPGLLGHVDPMAGLLTNLAAIWSLLKDPFVRKNLLLVCLIGAGLALRRGGILTGRVRRALGVIAGALAVSLFHVLPGYPGELFFRLFVPAAVVGAGLAGKVVVLYWGQQGPQRFVSGGLAVGLAITAIFWGKHLMDAINLRPEVVLDARVKTQLDRLPDDATILYGETEIALLSCLLEGGQRFGALAFPMLADTVSLEKLVQARHPGVLVVPAARSLNTLAVQRAMRLNPRRLGFFLPVVDRITIRAPEGKSLSDLHVYVTNGSRQLTLQVSAPRSPQAGGSLTTGYTVPEAFEGWLRLWDPGMDGVDEAVLTLPNAWAWIEGVATDPPRANVRWPWESGIRVSYHVRDKPPEKGGSIQFSVSNLLAMYRAGSLKEFVPRDGAVISDDSGLVFLRTIFAGRGA